MTDDEIYRQVKEFSVGQYIVREGEMGAEFFIIREGSVQVVKEIGVPAPVHIVSLREGHFFGDFSIIMCTRYCECDIFAAPGEMSLVSDEPRVASVIANHQPTICLSLSKSAFKAALTATKFCDVLHDVVEQRKKLRQNRSR